MGVLAEQLGHVPAAALRGVRDTIDLSARLARRPWAGVTAAAHFAGSLERVLAPAPSDPSPLLRSRSLSWRFEALEVPLAALKRAGKAAGGSLNDAYVAARLGGLRHYHEAHGVDVHELPIAFPVSLRTDDHPMGGNRFAGVRFAAPTGVEDPVERIQAIHEFVLDVRDEPAIDALGLAAPLLNRLPIAAVPGGTRIRPRT